MSLTGAARGRAPRPEQKDYSEVELTHCRAAMLAFGGVITQSALFETGFP